MKYLIIAVLMLTSCQSKRFKDAKGVYVLADSCVKAHSYTQNSFIMIGKVMYPQSYTVTECDSSVITKHYLGR